LLEERAKEKPFLEQLLKEGARKLKDRIET